MAEMAKDGARHATPDAPERIGPRRRCTRHDHRTSCRGSRGSASLPCPRCENASKCATPDRAERVPTIGLNLIPYVDAHGQSPDGKTANWPRPKGLRRIGVSASGNTAFRHGYNDQEVSTELTMPCKRRHAHTPIRRHVSPSRPILITTIYLLFRGQDTKLTTCSSQHLGLTNRGLPNFTFGSRAGWRVRS